MEIVLKIDFVKNISKFYTHFRIMAHPELQGDLEWREKQCQLLIDYSLFNSHSVGENSDQNIGPRLAGKYCHPSSSLQYKIYAMYFSW